MKKYLLKSIISKITNNIIGEIIALLLILNTLELNCIWQLGWLLLIYSVVIRLIWQSAIIIHGLGHTIIIALCDQRLSVFSVTNILEHQKIHTALKSLLPFSPIFTPLLSSSESISFPLYLETGHPSNIRIKALGGILLNLSVAISFLIYSDNLITEIIAWANLLIAIFSLSDLEAWILGQAECFYCGNFGFVAKRQPNDENILLPKRMLSIGQKMGKETEIRGEQAGGGLVLGRKNESTVFVGTKIVNRKRRNLTQSLETAFAADRKKATRQGIIPQKSSVIAAWHYRYATSGAAPSVLETHWHQWMKERKEKVWYCSSQGWKYKIENVNHRITHNGDFDSWQIFGEEINNQILGLWLERVLHTDNASKGDSPKIAGLMDLLVTKGMWYPSVRLAYQLTKASSIEDAFGGQKPNANAPNTAPNYLNLTAWTEIFEQSFQAEYLSSIDYEHEKVLSINLNSFKNGPFEFKYSIEQQENLLARLKSHSSTANWSELQIKNFIQATLQAFWENDLYKATKIFISQAKGSFGLVTTSTLEKSILVLCAKGEPISIGCNKKQGYTIYASEPAAVDRILLNQPNSYRIDLNSFHGEVAKIGADKITVYDLLQQQELTTLQIKFRLIPMTQDSYISQVKFTSTKIKDPIKNDLDEIPQTLEKIKISWRDSSSINRHSANDLIYLLVEKAKRIEQIQKSIHQKKINRSKVNISTLDLLITGEENSLWLGQKFAEDLKIVFPLLNVQTIAANQVLHQLNSDVNQLNLDHNTILLAITQSGQTYSTIQVVSIFKHMSSRGIVSKPFIMTGELSSFLDLIKDKSNFNIHYRNRIFFNYSGRRITEAATNTVAATAQSLTELLLYCAKQIRKEFPNSEPLGMTLSKESIMVLTMMKDDFVSKNVSQIIGVTSQGKLFQSNTRKYLIKGASYWANHITEVPLAWAIHATYILVSVGWVIPFGNTLSLARLISGIIFSLGNFSPGIIRFLSPVITLSDILIYIFGTWLWTLVIRFTQGRQLFARMGKRTLIIGDVFWVHQILEAYVSKLFSLSYGIATIEVHSANSQNHLLHNFAHRVVRGTLVWLGVPDGRRTKEQKAREDAALMTGKQINGIKNYKTGAEIVALVNNPEISSQVFSHVFALDDNNDTCYYRSAAVIKQKEQIEKLRESCICSFERLLASYVFFWVLIKKVTSFPFLGYEYWKSQSRSKVMTTPSPIFSENDFTSSLDQTVFTSDQINSSESFSQR